MLPLHGVTSTVIDVEIEHNSLVYTTVVAENHAGLRSVFKGGPLRYDKTVASITDLETRVTANNNGIGGNETNDSLDIVVNWKAIDTESGVKYCTCGYGKEMIYELNLYI